MRWLFSKGPTTCSLVATCSRSMPTARIANATPAPKAKPPACAITATPGSEWSTNEVSWLPNQSRPHTQAGQCHTP